MNGDELKVYPTARHIEAEDKKAANMAKARRNWRIIRLLIAAAFAGAIYTAGLHDGREYMGRYSDCRK